MAPGPGGAVADSSRASQIIAWLRESPHISRPGASPEQNAGRSGLPKMRHAFSSSNCTQRIPAGFPAGMPGIGLVTEGAMQQAPQPGRHSMICVLPRRPLCNLLAGQLLLQVDPDTGIDELRRV